MSRKIFVTGASGLIGRSLVLALRQHGYHVYGGYYRSQPSINGVQWVQLDLLDVNSYSQQFRSISPDILVHAAWVTQADDIADVRLNSAWLQASTNLLTLFMEQGGQHFLGIGSCAEYSWDSSQPYKETDLSRPSGIYGVFKQAFHIVSRALCEDKGVSYTWLRPFFVYGPGEPGSKLISSVISTIVNGELFTCNSGNAVRDYIHVNDLAAVLVSLIDSQKEGCFNLGTGRALSIRDLVLMMEKTLGVQGAIEIQPGKDDSVVVADTVRLGEIVDLGRFKRIEDGIAEMCHIATKK